MRHKLYSSFQSLVTYTSIKRPINRFGDRFIYFNKLEKDGYDFVLVIVDWLTKMVYYELVKITINASALAEIIINVIDCYYGLLNLIETNKSLLLISKFWLLLYYFLAILTEQHFKNLSLRLCQLWAEQLSQAFINDQVCLKQYYKCKY